MHQQLALHSAVIYIMLYIRKVLPHTFLFDCFHNSGIGIPFSRRLKGKLLSFSVCHNLTICEAKILPTSQGGETK